METIRLSHNLLPSTDFNQHCILQSTILALKWPMCADVPLNHIKISGVFQLGGQRDRIQSEFRGILRSFDTQFFVILYLILY